MAVPTISKEEPRICEGCENPVPPYRWANLGYPAFGQQCSCEVPKDPFEIKPKYHNLFRRDLLPSEAELIKAREMTDAGIRLAMPWLFDGLGGTHEPEPLDPDDVTRVADYFETARDELVRGAMKVLDKARDREGASELHLKVGEVVQDIEGLQRELLERYGS